jgi:hypothetical protein
MFQRLPIGEFWLPWLIIYLVKLLAHLFTKMTINMDD